MCALAPVAGAASLVTSTRIGNPDARITLSYWVQPQLTHLSTRPEVAQVFREVYEAWAREHPDVKIELTLMPELEQHKQKLMLAATQGAAPDMASVDSFWVPWFVSRNLLQPLGDLWPAADRADFFPFTLSGVSDAAGNVYAIWHSTDMRVLYYRKDLVPVPPKTWDQLIQIGKEVARRQNIAGFLFNGGRWEATTFDNLAHFWALGGDLVDASGKPVFNEGKNREAMLQVLRFLRRTVQEGVSPAHVANILNYDELNAAAVANSVAMFQGGNWQIFQLQEQLPRAEFEKWAVAPLPMAREGIASTGTGGWTYGIFTRDPGKRRAAFEFFAHLTATENMARITSVYGNLPTRRSVYAQVPFFSQNQWFSKYGQWLPSGRARPGVAIYPTISEQLQLAIGAVLTGTKTPERALDDAWTEVMREYNRL